ncbi:MAG TPA: hypothetical protein VE973_02555, partial [Candidatus Limnocylindria bacterium]|nr:hypothetical protein [Candidatus Limnocylindria bacterium]
MANAATIGQDSDKEKSSSKAWVIPGPFPGDDRIRVNYIYINKGPKFVPKNNIPLKTGDVIKLVGPGMGLFEKAVFADLEPITYTERSDAIVSFTVPDLSETVGDGKTFIFKLLSSGPAGIVQEIAPAGLYSVKKEKDGEKAKKQSDKRGQEGSTKQEEGSEVISELLNEAIGGVPEAFGRGLGIGAAASAAAPAAKSFASAAQNQKKKDDASVEGHDDDATIQEDQPPVFRGTEKEAFEVVGEYIDKNPQTISNNAVRTEVLAALQAGSVTNLSQEAHTALQGVVSSQTVSQTVGQSQAAFAMVGRQVATTQTQVSGTAQVSVEQSQSALGGGSSTQVEVGQTSSGQSSASAQIQTEVSGTVSDTVQGSAGATGQVNIRQSIEMVGEQLYKNPGLIASIDTQVRGDILEAMGSDNIGGLSAEAKTTLKTTLQNLSRESSGQSSQIRTAAQQVQQNLGSGQARAE